MPIDEGNNKQVVSSNNSVSGSPASTGRRSTLQGFGHKKFHSVYTDYLGNRQEIKEEESVILQKRLEELGLSKTKYLLDVPEIKSSLLELQDGEYLSQVSQSIILMSLEKRIDEICNKISELDLKEPNAERKLELLKNAAKEFIGVTEQFYKKITVSLAEDSLKDVKLNSNSFEVDKKLKNTGMEGAYNHSIINKKIKSFETKLELSEKETRLFKEIGSNYPYLSSGKITAEIKDFLYKKLEKNKGDIEKILAENKDYLILNSLVIRAKDRKADDFKVEKDLIDNLSFIKDYTYIRTAIIPSTSSYTNMTVGSVFDNLLKISKQELTPDQKDLLLIDLEVRLLETELELANNGTINLNDERLNQIEISIQELDTKKQSIDNKIKDEEIAKVSLEVEEVVKEVSPYATSKKIVDYPKIDPELHKEEINYRLETINSMASELGYNIDYMITTAITINEELDKEKSFKNFISVEKGKLVLDAEYAYSENSDKKLLDLLDGEIDTLNFATKIMEARLIREREDEQKEMEEETQENTIVAEPQDAVISEDDQFRIHINNILDAVAKNPDMNSNLAGYLSDSYIDVFVQEQTGTIIIKSDNNKKAEYICTTIMDFMDYQTLEEKSDLKKATDAAREYLKTTEAKNISEVQTLNPARVKPAALGSGSKKESDYEDAEVVLNNNNPPTVSSKPRPTPLQVQQEAIVETSKDQTSELKKHISKILGSIKDKNTSVALIEQFKIMGVSAGLISKDFQGIAISEYGVQDNPKNIYSIYNNIIKTLRYEAVEGRDLAKAINDSKAFLQNEYLPTKIARKACEEFIKKEWKDKVKLTDNQDLVATSMISQRKYDMLVAKVHDLLTTDTKGLDEISQKEENNLVTQLSDSIKRSTKILKRIGRISVDSEKLKEIKLSKDDRVQENVRGQVQALATSSQRPLPTIPPVGEYSTAEEVLGTGSSGGLDDEDKISLYDQPSDLDYPSKNRISTIEKTPSIEERTEQHIAMRDAYNKEDMRNLRNQYYNKIKKEFPDKNKEEINQEVERLVAELMEANQKAGTIKKDGAAYKEYLDASLEATRAQEQYSLDNYTKVTKDSKTTDKLVSNINAMLQGLSDTYGHNNMASIYANLNELLADNGTKITEKDGKPSIEILGNLEYKDIAEVERKIIQVEKIINQLARLEKVRKIGVEEKSNFSNESAEISLDPKDKLFIIKFKSLDTEKLSALSKDIGNALDAVKEGPKIAEKKNPKHEETNLNKITPSVLDNDREKELLQIQLNTIQLHKDIRSFVNSLPDEFNQALEVFAEQTPAIKDVEMRNLNFHKALDTLSTKIDKNRKNLLENIKKLQKTAAKNIVEFRNATKQLEDRSLEVRVKDNDKRFDSEIIKAKKDDIDAANAELDAELAEEEIKTQRQDLQAQALAAKEKAVNQEIEHLEEITNKLRDLTQVLRDAGKTTEEIEDIVGAINDEIDTDEDYGITVIKYSEREGISLALNGSDGQYEDDKHYDELNGLIQSQLAQSELALLTQKIEEIEKNMSQEGLTDMLGKEDKVSSPALTLSAGESFKDITNNDPMVIATNIQIEVLNQVIKKLNNPRLVETFAKELSDKYGVSLVKDNNNNLYLPKIEDYETRKNIGNISSFTANLVAVLPVKGSKLEQEVAERVDYPVMIEKMLANTKLPADILLKQLKENSSYAKRNNIELGEELTKKLEAKISELTTAKEAISEQSDLSNFFRDLEDGQEEVKKEATTIYLEAGRVKRTAELFGLEEEVIRKIGYEFVRDAQKYIMPTTFQDEKGNYKDNIKDLKESLINLFELVDKVGFEPKLQKQIKAKINKIHINAETIIVKHMNTYLAGNHTPDEIKTELDDRWARYHAFTALPQAYERKKAESSHVKFSDNQYFVKIERVEEDVIKQAKLGNEQRYLALEEIKEHYDSLDRSLEETGSSAKQTIKLNKYKLADLNELNEIFTSSPDPISVEDMDDHFKVIEAISNVKKELQELQGKTTNNNPERISGILKANAVDIQRTKVRNNNIAIDRSLFDNVTKENIRSIEEDISEHYEDIYKSSGKNNLDVLDNHWLDLQKLAENADQKDLDRRSIDFKIATVAQDILNVENTMADNAVRASKGGVVTAHIQADLNTESVSISNKQDSGETVVVAGSASTLPNSMREVDSAQSSNPAQAALIEAMMSSIPGMNTAQAKELVTEYNSGIASEGEESKISGQVRTIKRTNLDINLSKISGHDLSLTRAQHDEVSPSLKAYIEILNDTTGFKWVPFTETNSGDITLRIEKNSNLVMPKNEGYGHLITTGLTSKEVIEQAIDERIKGLRNPEMRDKYKNYLASTATAKQIDSKIFAEAEKGPKEREIVLDKINKHYEKLYKKFPKNDDKEFLNFLEAQVRDLEKLKDIVIKRTKLIVGDVSEGDLAIIQQYQTLEKLYQGHLTRSKQDNSPQARGANVARFVQAIQEERKSKETPEVMAEKLKEIIDNYNEKLPTVNTIEGGIKILENTLKSVQELEKIISPYTKEDSNGLADVKYLQLHASINSHIENIVTEIVIVDAALAIGIKNIGDLSSLRSHSNYNQIVKEISGEVKETLQENDFNEITGMQLKEVARDKIVDLLAPDKAATDVTKKAEEIAQKAFAPAYDKMVIGDKVKLRTAVKEAILANYNGESGKEFTKGQEFAVISKLKYYSVDILKGKNLTTNYINKVREAVNKVIQNEKEFEREFSKIKQDINDSKEGAQERALKYIVDIDFLSRLEHTSKERSETFLGYIKEVTNLMIEKEVENEQVRDNSKTAIEVVTEADASLNGEFTVDNTKQEVAINQVSVVEPVKVPHKSGLMARLKLSLVGFKNAFKSKEVSHKMLKNNDLTTHKMVDVSGYKIDNIKSDCGLSNENNKATYNSWCEANKEALELIFAKPENRAKATKLVINFSKASSVDSEVKALAEIQKMIRDEVLKPIVGDISNVNDKLNKLSNYILEKNHDISPLHMDIVSVEMGRTQNEIQGRKADQGYKTSRTTRALYESAPNYIKNKDKKGTDEKYSQGLENALSSELPGSKLSSSRAISAGVEITKF